MNTYGVDLMGRRRRRRHSAEFKAAVIEECLRPGVSIAAVALAHGLNANMLRKWVIDGEHRLAAPTPVPTPVCVFRPIVTGRSGNVTADFGIVTGRSGIVTERAG